MSNNGCLIGFPNRVDEGTLSGGSFVPTLPLNNLKSRLLGKVARTTSTALSDTTFTLSYSGAKVAKVAALVNHNLSLDAKWRIRCSDEDPMTNLLLHTEEFAAWNTFGTIVQSNFGFAPDGAATADKLTPTTVNTQHVITKDTEVQPAGRYTMSVFVSSVGYSKIILAQPSNDSASATFHLSDQVAIVNAGDGAYASVEIINDDWYRVSLSYTTTSAYRHTMAIYMLNELGQQTFIGSGSGFLMWGAQVEVGNSATSYYPSKVTFVSRGSSGSYVNSSGNIQMAAANVARMTYNPDDLSAAPSLMVEDAATNFVTGSSSLVEGWSGNCSIASTSTSYLGIFMWRVSKTTTSPSEHRNVFVRSMAAGEALTLTFVARAGTVSTMSFSLYDAAGGTLEGLADNSYASIVKGPGTLTRSFGSLFTVTGLSSTETTFLKLTRKYTATGEARAYFYPGTHNSITIGNNTLMGRVQCELGEYATSYIPTGASAVNRAKDIVTLDVTRPSGYMDNWQRYSSSSGYIDVWPRVFSTTELDWEADNYWSGTYTQEDTQGYTPCAVHIFNSPVRGTYWKVDIQDTTNTAGYLQIGRLFLGPAWSPAYDAEVGLSIGWESSTTTQSALSGTKYFQRRTPYRVTSFVLNNMSVDEAMEKAFELDRMAGIDKEVFWVQAEADANHALRRRFLGTLRQMTPVEFPYAHLGRKGYTIEEVI